MNNLKELLNTKLVTPSIESQTHKRTCGIIINAYEKENTCDVQYYDAKNHFQYKERVEVKLTGANNNWFPSNGALVEIELFDDKVFIIGEVIIDFNTQIKPKLTLKKDIYANGSDTSVGCYIF